MVMGNTSTGVSASLGIYPKLFCFRCGPTEVRLLAEHVS